MGNNIYPDPRRLFNNIAGRKSRYTPQQIADEFLKYIKDLSETAIEVESVYQRQQESAGRTQQRRVMKYARPPKILDFVTRWLGMTHQWWYALPNGKNGDKYSAVIQRVEQYCYDVKFDGAVVGLYNASIIARDLGLADNIAITKRDDIDEMSVEEMKKEYERIGKLIR